MKIKSLFLLAAGVVFQLLFCACVEMGDPEYIYGPAEKLNRSEAAVRMQEFVEEISVHAQRISQSENFLVIPQNGIELAFENLNPGPGTGPRDSYIDAIDGIGVEELFFDERGSPITDSGRLDMLETFKAAGKKVMVSDVVNTIDDASTSIDSNHAFDFIAFPRIKDYHYTKIPDNVEKNVHTFTSDDVTTLADAENYLYLLEDNRFSTKPLFISAIKNTDYDIILIDLFFQGTNNAMPDPFTFDEIASMKVKSNGKARRLVIAYVSIGSAERYRYYFDQSKWTKGYPSWLKADYIGYPDEYWVQFWHPYWQDIILYSPNAYINRVVKAGFDGVYLDNVEAYLHVAK